MMMTPRLAVDKIPCPQVAALGDEVALHDKELLGATVVVFREDRPGLKFDVEEHVVPPKVRGQDLDAGAGVGAGGPLTLGGSEEMEAVGWDVSHCLLGRTGE